MPIVESPVVESPITLARRDVGWPDEAATAEFATQLARAPALRGALVTLHGDLGAGKTSFARHLLQALGVKGRIKSPTYSLAEVYELDGFSAWHCDFYRFSDPREWEDAGLRDAFAAPGLKLVEWPEKASPLLPLADLSLHINVDTDNIRRVQVLAYTPIGRTIVESVAQ